MKTSPAPRNKEGKRKEMIDDKDFVVSRSQLSKETKFTTERRMPASPIHVFTLKSLKSFELLEIGLKTGYFM